MRWLSKRLILFLIGFVIYIVIELIFRHYTYFESGILGGISFLLIDSVNNLFGFDLDFLVQCVIGSSIVTFLELIVGEIAKHSTFLPVMWDYSNMPLNFDGVICLPFSLAWLLLSSVAILIADSINYYWLRNSEQPYYKLFGKEILRFKEIKQGD